MALYESFCGCPCHTMDVDCGNPGPCCPNAGRKTQMYKDMMKLLEEVEKSRREKEKDN